MTQTEPVSPDVRRVQVAWRDYHHEIEYAWVGVSDPLAPVMVFLHEGLGSLQLWKDYPHALATATGFRGLVFSRWGYGHSSPRPHELRWPVDFMHQQARHFLPAFFEAIGIDTLADPPWLFGHSDGGTIALLYAAAFPSRAAGLIVVAPHLFVEQICVDSITQAREAYLTTDLPRKLGRYHADPDSAFWGWNDVWLDPAFKTWNIEAELRTIRCPVLAVQGYDDEYGTMAQLDAVAAQLPHAESSKITDCGHSPHRDQPEALTQAVAAFLAATRSSAG